MGQSEGRPFANNIVDAHREVREWNYYYCRCKRCKYRVQVAYYNHCRVAVKVNSFNSFCTIKNNYKASRCPFEVFNSKKKKKGFRERCVLLFVLWVCEMRFCVWGSFLEFGTSGEACYDVDNDEILMGVCLQSTHMPDYQSCVQRSYQHAHRFNHHCWIFQIKCNAISKTHLHKLTTLHTPTHTNTKHKLLMYHNFIKTIHTDLYVRPLVLGRDGVSGLTQGQFQGLQGWKFVL